MSDDAITDSEIKRIAERIFVRLVSSDARRSDTLANLAGFAFDAAAVFVRERDEADEPEPYHFGPSDPNACGLCGRNPCRGRSCG